MIKRAWGKGLLLFVLIIFFVSIISFASQLKNIKVTKTEDYLKISFVFDSEVSDFSTRTNLSMENFFVDFKNSESSLNFRSLDVSISPVFRIEIDSKKPLKISMKMIFPRLPQIVKNGNTVIFSFKRYEKKADFVFTDTDLRFVANYIAEMMGISIIVDQQVKALPISLNLKNASPEDAFIDILKTHNDLGYVILPDQTLYISGVSNLMERFGNKVLIWKIYDFSDFSPTTKKFIRETLSNLFNMMKQPNESFVVIPPSEIQPSQITGASTTTELKIPEASTFLVLLKARKETHDKFEEIVSYLGRERITQSKIKLKYLNPKDLLKKSEEIKTLFNLDEFEVLPETGYVSIKGKVQNVREASNYIDQLEKTKETEIKSKGKYIPPKRIEIFETVPINRKIDEPLMKKLKEFYPKATLDYIDGGTKLFLVGTRLELDDIKRIIKDFGYISEPQKTEFVPAPPKYIDNLVEVLSNEYKELIVKKLRDSILLLKGSESQIDEAKKFLNSLEDLLNSRDVKILRKIITLDPKTIDNAKSLIKIVVPSVKVDSVDELGILVLNGAPEDVHEALKLIESYAIKDEDIQTISMILKGLDYSKVNDIVKFYGLEGKIITYYIPEINLLLMRGQTSDLVKIYREISKLDENISYKKKSEELENRDVKTKMIDKIPQLSFDDVKKMVNSMFPELNVEETTDKYILRGKTENVEKAVEYLESVRTEILSERFKVLRISENVSIDTVKNVIQLYSLNLKVLNLSPDKIILKGDPSEITKIQEILKGLGLLDLEANKNIQLLKVGNLDPQEATKLLKVYFPDLKVDYLPKAQTFILVGSPDDVVGAMALLKNFSATYVPKKEETEKKLENQIKFNEDGTFDIFVEDFTVEEVLKYIADKLGKNLMLSIPMPEKLKLSSRGLTWEKFLRIIEQNFGYVFDEVSGVITPKKIEKISSEPEMKKYVYKVNYNIDEVDSLIKFYGGKTYVDRKNNLIIVTGITEEKKKELDELIKQVSTPLKQVEIEARVVDKSLVDDLFRSINTILSTNEALSGDTSVTVGKGEKTVSKTNVILGGEESVKTIEEKLTSSGLNLYTGILSKLEYEKFMNLLLNQLGAIVDVNASKDDSIANTLSSPKIVTMSGNTAEIHVGDKVPYIKKTIVDAKEQTSVEFINTGIRLQITPTVKPDNSIELNIVAEISNISGTRYAGPDQGDLPIISSRNANTHVIIKDGETLVIGGLTTTVKTDSVSKLPFVGNLPFIGELFKTKKKVDQKRELMIFITAKVVD